METWRAPGDSPLLQLLFSVLPEGEREKSIKSFDSFCAPHEKKVLHLCLTLQMNAGGCFKESLQTILPLKLFRS